MNFAKFLRTPPLAASKQLINLVRLSISQVPQKIIKIMKLNVKPLRLPIQSLHKKLNFPSRISSVNVTRSAEQEKNVKLILLPNYKSRADLYCPEICV